MMILLHPTGSFVSLKDPTPKQYKSSIVYEFKRPGCNANYIGKPTVAYTQELKNTPPKTLLKYII